jgi:hypothetical protein
MAGAALYSQVTPAPSPPLPPPSPYYLLKHLPSDPRPPSFSSFSLYSLVFSPRIFFTHDVHAELRLGFCLFWRWQYDIVRTFFATHATTPAHAY